MDQKAMFLKFWDKEAPATRKVLSRIPEGSDYRPDPKSRTAREIAWLLVCEEKSLGEGFQKGVLEWSEAPAPATMAEVLQAYDREHAAATQKLQGVDVAGWDREIPFVYGGQEVMKAPGWENAWGFHSPTGTDAVPAPEAVEGLADLVATLRRVRAALNPALDIEGVLLTMYDERTNLGQQVARDVRQFFKEKTFDTVIPRNVRLGEAPSHGIPVVLYDVKSRGAEAYLAPAREFLERHARRNSTQEPGLAM